MSGYDWGQSTLEGSPAFPGGSLPYVSVGSRDGNFLSALWHDLVGGGGAQSGANSFDNFWGGGAAPGNGGSGSSMPWWFWPAVIAVGALVVLKEV